MLGEISVECRTEVATNAKTSEVEGPGESEQPDRCLGNGTPEKWSKVWGRTRSQQREPAKLYSR